jgi:hypothetical protein
MRRADICRPASRSTWRVLVRGACLPIAIAVGGASAHAESCGKLCEFEREATKPGTVPGKTDSPKHRAHSSADDDESLAALLIRPFADLIVLAIAEGGANSNLRAGGGDERVRPRQDGEALISRLRVDAGRQRIDSATDAWDLRIEAGDGALGVQGRLTRYREELADSPPAASRLDFRQAHVLYRMSGEFLEVDLGIGMLQMSGRDTHSALSFTVPVLIHPVPWLGIEYRPAWARIAIHAVRDQELALMLGGRFASLRLGYRRVDTDGGTTGAVLQGPFMGVSIRY